MACSSWAIAALVLLSACMTGGSLAATVVVGGSKGWRFGYNYTDWSLKHGPFYYNDTLVFNYAPPSRVSRPHSVYLLPNLYSYVNCDFRRAQLISNPSEGDGNGFTYVLNQWRPLYFASREGNGKDCDEGLMKFFVVPLPRWFD